MIHLIITGDHKLLGGRISAAADDKIGFRLTDKAEFALDRGQLPQGTR